MTDETSIGELLKRRDRLFNEHKAAEAEVEAAYDELMDLQRQISKVYEESVGCLDADDRRSLKEFGHKYQLARKKEKEAIRKANQAEEDWQAAEVQLEAVFLSEGQEQGP